jgi:hypothetical protein
MTAWKTQSYNYIHDMDIILLPFVKYSPLVGVPGVARDDQWRSLIASVFIRKGVPLAIKPGITLAL